MSPRSLTLISEDILSEALAHRLLAHVAPDAEFTTSMGRQGNHYVLTRLRNLNLAARAIKIVAILDRDTLENCPIELIRNYLGGPKHDNFAIRFAEMEAESWVMADGDRISEFLDVPTNRIPSAPDALPNPKEALVNIARRSRNRQIREGLCPAQDSRHPVGPLYNAMLENFVRVKWRVRQAAAVSPSLERAVQRIRELALR